MYPVNRGGPKATWGRFGCRAAKARFRPPREVLPLRCPALGVRKGAPARPLVLTGGEGRVDPERRKGSAARPCGPPKVMKTGAVGQALGLRRPTRPPLRSQGLRPISANLRIASFAI